MSSRSTPVLLHALQYLVLVLLLTMPVWAMLTRPGLPATQAGPLPVLKLQVVEQGYWRVPAVMMEQPDRWRSDGPWGTAFTWGFPKMLDGLTSTKMTMIFVVLLSVVGLFFWGTTLVGGKAGVLSALIVVFSPLFLSTLYRAGDIAALGTLAGLVIAGWSLMLTHPLGLVLVAYGAFASLSSQPGLGLWALAGLLLLAGSKRHWRGIIALLVGATAGILVSTPWALPSTPASGGVGASLHQLVEPGWLWGVRTLGLDTPLSFSLGFALLALLILAVWSYFQRSEVGRGAPSRSPGVGDQRSENNQQSTINSQQKTKNGDQRSEVGRGAPSRSPWVGGTNPQSAIRNPQLLWHLAIGLLFVFFSLDFVAQRLSFVSTTVAAPWHLLLLALPFLAVAAVSALRFIPRLQETPLWAGLLIIAILGAGPGLSPDFQSYSIPAAPIAIFGDNQVMLLNLDRAGRLEADNSILLEIDWFSPRPIDFDYNVFIHVVDDTGKTIAQLDTQPQAGARPMTTWLPGEIISDRYELAIPPGAPIDLHLRLGLYNWQTGDRLAVGVNDAIEIHH